jgi:hypothetical protein
MAENCAKTTSCAALMPWFGLRLGFLSVVEQEVVCSERCGIVDAILDAGGIDPADEVADLRPGPLQKAIACIRELRLIWTIQALSGSGAIPTV